jgi:N-acetylglucosaminyldiphosphoundecaprenol N-acetyl-beta-D-mannosaminyltransferase
MADFDKINILAVDIAAVTRDLFREEVVGLLRGAGPRIVAKLNAEFLLRSMGDHEFRRYLRNSDLNIADGIGVLWAARFLTLGTTRLRVLRELQILWQAAYCLGSLVLFPRFCRSPIPERIPGVDALFAMLEGAQEAQASVYFLGAEQAINLKARQEIRSKYPRLEIAGGSEGYSVDDESARGKIDESGATMLVVALGSPRQEYWIRDNLPLLKRVKVAVGEGGSLDFIAGDFRRAPDWLQRMGLEWLWRLFMNRNKTGSGSRGRRVWNAVPVFVCRVVGWKLTHRQSEPDSQGGP